MSPSLTQDDELARQLKAVRKGETETIVCPWCGIFNNAESGDCCVDMAEARERLGEQHLQSIERQFTAVRNGLRDESVQVG